MTFRSYICPLLCVVAFTSCSPAQSETESKNASKEYEIVTKQGINLSDFFLQKETEYLVFCHSDTCTHCKEIMGGVIAFAKEIIIKTYFLNISLETNKIKKCPVNELTIGVGNYEDLYIAGTPTIIKVENQITTKNIPGKDDCLTFLNEQRKQSLE